MKNWLKRHYFRLVNFNNNVKIGKNVELSISNSFGGHNVIGNDAIIGNSHIGFGTYIAGRSAVRTTHIGRFCSIGSNVLTGMGRHPTSDFVSTHPSFFSTRMQAGFSFVKEDIFEEHIFADSQQRYVVVIGNDVWIGNNVMIMDGVTIGDGAIVAAGAIVTKDVLPYTIVAGTPAKFIRLRFEEQDIEKLLKLKWWDWDINKIQANSHLFRNIKQFIASYDDADRG